MAPPAQRPSSRATAQSAGKRSPVPQSSASETAAIAQPVAALQQRAPGEAAADAEPDGNLGAPDSRAEAAGASTPLADAATPAGPPSGSAECSESPARNAAGRASARDRFRPLQEAVFSAGT